jgi:N-acetylneuraminic acid mutarotase
MSVSSRRTFFLSFVFLLLAGSAWAVYPTARNYGRMVYNPVSTHTILFGGTTAVDAGTKLSYELDDTWDWNGAHWTQLFPATTPPARYAHVMVWDSKRNRIVMFGGRSGNNKQDLNDTWIYQNGDWTQLQPAQAPPARVLAGGAYDPVRDRVIVFGGLTISSDNKTLTHYYDTWEFDGTTWTQVLADGPHVDKPLLVWDAARTQTTLLGVDSTLATHQYDLDPAAPFWNAVTGIALPTCANDGALVFQTHNNTLFYTGGVCSGSNGIEDDLEFDGTQWNAIKVTTPLGRVFAQAMAYDQARHATVLFGGTPLGGTIPRYDTWLYTNSNWTFTLDPNDQPFARSLFVFQTDPINNQIYFFGGLDPNADYADFWRYQYGKWEQITAADGPASACITPAGAYDTNRNVLVVVCADSSLFEWNGTSWKAVTTPKTAPSPRRLARMVYDANLKKSVFFGGYNTDYSNDTWTWDGTSWNRITKNLPPPRELAAMWFDPVLNRTVIFGGVGKPGGTQDRVDRFNDMWSFDGNGWTEIKPATVPPPRYAAMTAVDPRDNTVLLYGGIRVDTIQTPGTGNNPPTTTQVQVYADDFWKWDGKDWKQVTYPRVPYARENGGLAFDPTTRTMVIFGGVKGGAYYSDLWTLTDTNGWQPVTKRPTRTRAAGR